MSYTESFETDDIHPIDIVEHLAESNKWDFDRISDEQINMAVEGQWRVYSVTLAWSHQDETLRLVCSFEMQPPAEKFPAVYELLNLINDRCWAGGFSYWSEENLLVYRYGLILAGEAEASSIQIKTMIGAAVNNSERYYPALQLAIWSDVPPEKAIEVAIKEAYGHA
jgi:hypothetical protein